MTQNLNWYILTKNFVIFKRWHAVKYEKNFNLNGSNDGLQINQNWIKKKIDEVEEDDDEAIAILAKHQGLKTRLKDNKALQILQSNYISLKAS